MFTLIKIWLISLVVWPVLLCFVQVILKQFSKKTVKAKDELARAMGIALITTGGLGAFFSADWNSYSFEFYIKLFAGLAFAVYGTILVLVTMEEQ